MMLITNEFLNLVSFNNIGGIQLNSTLNPASVPNLKDATYYRRDMLAVNSGFVYIPEIINIPGFPEYHVIAKYSLPNLVREGNFTTPYNQTRLNSINFDEKNTMWLGFSSRPDKNYTGYDSRNQIVSQTFFGYSLSSKIDTD